MSMRRLFRFPWKTSRDVTAEVDEELAFIFDPPRVGIPRSTNPTPGYRLAADLVGHSLGVIGVREFR